MSFDLGLAGRRALVTGGTKGVGAAVVAALRDAGAEILTTARSAPDKALADGVRFVAADVCFRAGSRPMRRSGWRSAACSAAAICPL